MLLAYDADRSTRDADSVFRPDGPVLNAAAEVADELGLPAGWLNQQASSYLPLGAHGNPDRAFDRPVHDGPNLRVAALNAKLLLAMKVRAARPHDIDDIVTLAAGTQLTGADEILRLAQDVYGPDDPLPPRSRPAVEEAVLRLGDAGGGQGSDADVGKV